MSLDPSLKVPGGSLAAHRNVLTRAERLQKLKDTKDFDPKKHPILGLPKTSNRKTVR